MHHSSEIPDEILQLLQTQYPDMARDVGATGKFPDGKLAENDEGEIAFGVVAFKGKVVVSFGKPVASLGLTPGQAMVLARSLRKYARQIEGGNSQYRKSKPGSF